MTADTIIINANILTMEPLAPRAEALAICNGRITAVGSTADIKALASQRTSVIDAGGRLVLPGFQDTHIHLQDSGYDYGFNAVLDECRTPAELQDVLRTFADKTAAAWVRGVGWYTGIFTDANLTRQVLDAVVADRPCYILASDGHNACLNSKACDMLGIRKGVEDPPNGHFVRDDNGYPTGMLHEDAIDWVVARMPPITDDDYANGVRFAQALCNRHGITGVLDASVKERHARVYQRLSDQNALTLHVAATAKVEPFEDTAAAVERLKALRAACRGDDFKIHSAKFFLDGVLENRTGVMLHPYSDGIGGNAPLMFGHNQVKDLFAAFDAARFQIHVHVIGDGALRAALDGLEAAQHANGAWPSLHQLAHVQCLDPADFPRFRSLAAMANIQPLWARHEPSVTDVALPMVGEARGKWMYAFRSLVDAGAPYCLSSDWGVSTLNPFPIIETAVTRQPPRKNGDHPVFLPEQRLTLAECLRGYTVNAAAAAWRSEDTGTLSPGKCADVIILDRDLFTCDPYDIGDTEVLLTLFRGRTVHAAGAFA
jgi:predicted amidohydrolase YtcJ